MAPAKGYELFEPRELNAVIQDVQNHAVAISILAWLAEELKRALPSELARVDVEVLFIHRGYPCLGLHYQDESTERVTPVVERTIAELLAKRPIGELVAFASDDKWIAIRDRLKVERNIHELSKS